MAVITQTTSLDDVAPIVDALGESQGGLRRPHADDICYATQNRQDAVRALVDEGATLVLVIAPRRARTPYALSRSPARPAPRRRSSTASPPRRAAPLRPPDDRAHRGRVDAGGARAGDGRAIGDARLPDARRGNSCPGARSFPVAEGGRTRMTSIEVPYSIAAALPTLSVMDVTNEVAQAVAGSDRPDGIAYVSATSSLSLIRVQERETGFFEDLENLLEHVVPTETPSVRAWSRRCSARGPSRSRSPASPWAGRRAPPRPLPRSARRAPAAVRRS